MAYDTLRIANRLNGNYQQVHQRLAESMGIILIGTVGCGIDILMRRAENWLIPRKGRGQRQRSGGSNRMHRSRESGNLERTMHLLHRDSRIRGNDDG